MCVFIMGTLNHYIKGKILSFTMNRRYKNEYNEYKTALLACSSMLFSSKALCPTLVLSLLKRKIRKCLETYKRRVNTTLRPYLWIIPEGPKELRRKSVPDYRITKKEQ